MVTSPRPGQAKQSLAANHVSKPSFLPSFLSLLFLWTDGLRITLKSKGFIGVTVSFFPSPIRF
jgi:hypothetical protein